MKKPGRYRAKRFGWDEEDDDPDRTPMSEVYESMDLEGELEVMEYVPGKWMYLVGGQETDHDTIERIDASRGGHSPGGKGGGP